MKICICVGPPRCGTTWLFEWMREHPFIATTEPKEINFFWHIGPHTQSEFAKYFSNVRDDGIAVEISPSYILDEEIPFKIAELSDRAKAIIMIRSPFDLIRSLGNKLLRDDDRRFTIQLARYGYEVGPVESVQSFLDDGVWTEIFSATAAMAKMICRLNELLGCDQVYIMNFDRIAKEPEKLAREICAFLNVPFVDSYLLYEVVNPSARPRSMKLLKLMRFIGAWFREFGLHRFVTGVKYRYFNRILFPSDKVVDYESEWEVVFRHFAEQFNEEISQIEEISNLDLSSWRRTYSS